MSKERERNKVTKEERERRVDKRCTFSQFYWLFSFFLFLLALLTQHTLDIVESEVVKQVVCVVQVTQQGATKKATQKRERERQV